MKKIKFKWKFYYNLLCSKLYENTKTVKTRVNLQREHGGQLWACKTVKCQACFLSPKLSTEDQTQYPCEDCQLSRKKIITMCIIFKHYQHKINVVHIIACVQTITKLWLVASAKQRRDPCSGPPTDSTNYRKCISNFPSTWLAIMTNKTKAFFNWPIVARTQIWVHSWKSRTRISALFRRRS